MASKTVAKLLMLMQAKQVTRAFHTLKANSQVARAKQTTKLNSPSLESESKLELQDEIYKAQTQMADLVKVLAKAIRAAH